MPKQGTPVSITLYGEGDEIISTHTRMFIPWRMLKAAVAISESMNMQAPTADDMDKLAGLVVEVFGGQFSVADLNEHADISEMIAVIQQIISKARGMVPN